jgi:CRP-like cAMP-binding protein
VKFRNSLLSALPKKDLEAFEAHLRVVNLAHNQILYQSGDKAETIYFPNTAVLSVITTMTDGRRIETATVGFESAVGVLPALSREPIFSQVVSQVGGEAVVMPSSALRSRVEQSPGLMQLILRFVNANMDQAAQSVACNALHQVDARLARWLLMTQDRTQGDEVPLTQEYLAVMCGVQRTTVTAACRDLKAAKLIKYARGRITIMDRAGLEQRACECYAANRESFERLCATVAA